MFFTKIVLFSNFCDLLLSFVDTIKLYCVYKIANYFGVNYMWLLGWDAEKIVTTSTRQEIDTILDGMNEQELKTVNKILKALIEKD